MSDLANLSNYIKYIPKIIHQLNFINELFHVMPGTDMSHC